MRWLDEVNYGKKDKRYLEDKLTNRTSILQGGKTMKNLMMRLWKEEEGQGMVEYGLILALVAVAAIVGLGLLGDKLDLFFKAIEAKIKNPA